MKLRAAVMILALAIAAVATAQNVPLMTDAPVGPKDQLDIKVLEDATINGRVMVADDGQIAIAVLGKVPVAGLTASEIEAKLRALLESTSLVKATVTVQVVEYASKPISIIGAVVHPGRIGTTGTTTLMQAITQAGGLSSSHGKQLHVLRTGKNGLSEQITIDIEELMVNGNPDLNIPLAPNDLINVPVDTPITIYVLGEVMKPGTAQFRSSQTPTLLQALAAVGGPTDRAKRIAVIKRMENGKQRTYKVNYKRILGGDDEDVVLKDSDTVWIDASIF